MLGYLLAGTDEASAPLIRIGDRAYKPYRGMASRGAMERRFAVDRYTRASKRVAEGVEGVVPYRGSVMSVLADLAEGIRAGLGYAGASNIRELWERARFGVAVPKQVPGELFRTGQ
jgi:inosine-5'-monophosphate dehydrogenase (EC 1.1.1.205)